MTDACECHRCAKLCSHSPGAFTPDETARAIDAGYAGRLMLDWWDQDSRVPGMTGKVWYVQPAVVGRESKLAPDLDEMTGGDIFAALFGPIDKGRCTFLTKGGKCLIHDGGFKPIQCRTAFGCRDDANDYSTFKEMVPL